ncbi:MAG: DUF3501 family protein [Candidatus Eisenbacteria bacterium]|nr:DUF3501 family protein [Candidatus Eisenbacteria bacterium]
MMPLSPEDLVPLEEYEAEREERRRRMIQLRARRRVTLGDGLSLVFENRETVLHQLHELIRAERLTDPEAIAREVEIYNGLLPPAGGLAATLFIELRDPAQMQEDLARFRGLAAGDQLWLDLGGERRVAARFDAAEDAGRKPASVYYLRFPLEDADRALLADENREAHLESTHSALQARAALAPETRRELIQDLSV